MESVKPKETEVLKTKIKQEAEYREAEKVEAITGLNVSEKGLYETQNSVKVLKYYTAKKKSINQNALNIQAQINVKNARQHKI